MIVEKKLYFENEKPKHVALHPYLPVVAVVMKHDMQVTVFDYADEAVMLQINVETLQEEKLERQVGVFSETQERTRFGEVKHVAFMDCVCSYWSMRPLHGMSPADVARMLKNRLYKMEEENILLISEFRVSVVPYRRSNLHYKSVRDKSHNEVAGGRTITCGTPLYSSPVIAVGNTDGGVKLWNIETDHIGSMLGVFKHSVTCLQAVHTDMEQIIDQKVLLLAGSVEGGVTCMMIDPAKQSSFVSKWTLKIGDSIIHTIEPHTSTKNVSLASVTTSLGIFVVDVDTGSETAKIKLPKKHGVTPVSSAPCNDFWVVAYEFNHVYTAGSDSSHPLTEIIDVSQFLKKKEVHIYNVTAHPLIHERIFVSTNAGLLNLRLKTKKTNENVIGCSTGDIMSCIAISGHKIKGHGIELNGAGRFPGFEVRGTGKVTGIAETYDGVLCIAEEIDNKISIFNGVTGDVISTLKGSAPVWHCSRQTFAVIVDGNIQTYDLIDSQPYPTTSAPIPKNATKLFGGKWVGLATQTHLKFLSWETLKPITDPLPVPPYLKWDPQGKYCALCYSEAGFVYVLTAKDGILQHHCCIHLEATSCLWVEGTLFIDTGTHLYIVYPYQDGYDSELLATTDARSFYDATEMEREGSQGGEEGGLLLRPSGGLAFLGLLGDTLCMSDLHGRVHGFRLSHSMKWKCYAQAGVCDQAHASAPASELASFLAHRDLARIPPAVSATDRASLCLSLNLYTQASRSIAEACKTDLSELGVPSGSLFGVLATLANKSEDDECVQIAINS
eukprot:TRINITY_DN8118_c0_g1_i1.p1 TRINITY_DN8118_c0_g1~~TRINITY_DN8118_c0_g1_i1.p1  ORF type:complete len:798 (+),score=127.84 TRINITY_DN8118_c0_g1_i1:50-2395(+)